MTELLLRKEGEEWQRVFFDTQAQSFKLTRENPYFTQSDSYTLDVSLPMDIIENRRIFRNLQRIDASKQIQPTDCRLNINNQTILQGVAKVMQVNEKSAKVQLIGGNSVINFLDAEYGEYIDELPLGEVTTNGEASGMDRFVTTNGVRLALSPANNETAGGWTNHFHFCLVDIMEKMLEHYGFSISENSVNCEPWNKVFVATAMQTTNVSHTLPHWTPKTFIEEFSKFFNVTLIFDQVNSSVRIIGAPAFFRNAERLTVDTEDEYTSEMTGSEDAHALAADRIAFNMSGSTHHDYDVIPDEIREEAPTHVYESKNEAVAAYEGMDESSRLKQIFKCDTGRFAGWKHDYSDVGEEDEQRTLFTQIDVFAPLERDSGSETKLKICPVAIGTEEYESTFGNGGSFGGGVTSGNETVIKTTMTLPSLENPTGSDTGVNIHADGSWWRGFGGRETEDLPTIQECIEGDADIEKKEKEDRLQVMFVDDVKQTYYVDNNGMKSERREFTFGFTDWQYKASHKNGETHNHWSFSLNPTEADAYLGQLHQNGFSFNMKAKHRFRFVSDRIPSAQALYIVRGKRYGCEKLEISITELGFDKLITGYFYEML